MMGLTPVGSTLGGLVLGVAISLLILFVEMLCGSVGADAGEATLVEALGRDLYIDFVAGRGDDARLPPMERSSTFLVYRCVYWKRLTSAVLGRRLLVYCTYTGLRPLGSDGVRS